MLQINVNLLNNLNVIFISLPTPNELFPLQADPTPSRRNEYAQ